MYLDFMTQAAVVAWAIVGIASTLTLFSRKCGSVIECCALAFIALIAFTKAIAYLRETIEIDGPALALGVAMAVYFVAKADASWSRRAVKDHC